ncbi:DAHP synthetase [Gonapodya prolifera JEL478]|uniref:Phospho-2-dehydro-3-deoxyheptonate aldolase n=1 Tax=Gonapodya prolifera (strain JEL478) TaxID=1344416 RepID=A0A139ASF4_GONPJ|nr:DAHP synthetase [Gonapodya prolifera JEL478]|eukprot:KXS19629.1 DAHP synthetase [Gonapodya prolifera JEL478]
MSPIASPAVSNGVAHPPSSTTASLDAPANGAKHSSKVDWTPSSWRTKTVAQDVHYDDKEKLNEVLDKIGKLPGLVGVGEIEKLRQQLAECAEGKRFLLQGGDCAERFDDCEESHIQNQLKVLLQMSLVIIWGARMPLVRIARMAGQYAKPRSSPIETVPPNHPYNPTAVPLTIPSFRGDNINGPTPTLTSRVPDPSRLLQAYFHSAATMNHIRTVLGEGFADLHRLEGWDLGMEYVVEEGLRADYRRVVTALTDALDFMGTVGADDLTRQSSLSTVEMYISHEGLSLEYEERLTRPATSRFRELNGDPRKRSPAPGSAATQQPGTFYNLGSHFIWLGDRTRQVDGAHVEYFRGIRNPIGIKAGPSMKPKELTSLLEVVDPDRETGRVVLITRFGAGKVEGALEPLVEAVRDGGWKVVWCCDPMHGNTHTTPSGIKTRSYPAIVSELTSTFEVHRKIGSRLTGVHFECTGDSVTECLGGSMDLQVAQLEERYETACDPRLNYEQSLDVAFVIAKHFERERRSQSLSK